MGKKLVDKDFSTGGYMSVDAAAAVRHNQPVIDKIREAFQQVRPTANSQQASPSVPEQSRQK